MIPITRSITLSRCLRIHWLPFYTALFLLLVGVCSDLCAAPLMVDMSEVKGEFPIENYVAYIADPDHRLTPEQLLDGQLDAKLIPNDGHSFDFGISEATYWLVFDLTYNSLDDGPVEVHKLLEINYPPLDRIDLYYRDRQGALQDIRTGDTLPFSSRPIVNNDYLFPITMTVGQTERFVVKVRTEGSIRVPMKLWDPAKFNEHNRTTLLLYGVYFGIISLMFIYNLILYVFVRDSTYLYYIFYIASFIFFQATYSGFAFEYLWPNHPHLNNVNLIAAIFLVELFAGHFTRRVLETVTTLPRIDLLLRAFALFALIMTPLSFFLSYHLMLNLAISSAILMVVLVVTGGVINSYRGIRTARFFLLAWFCFLVGAVVLGAVAAGYLPANFFTNNALILGSAIEVTLLSLSLADRINRIERERTRAEQQAKQALISVNKTLVASNKVKDEFLNTISHEMRTPMHGVLSSINHIRHQDYEQQRSLFVDSAERSAQQMMILIDSILNYTELHSDSFKLERDPFTLTRLINSLEDLFRSQAQAKGLDFIVDVHPDVPDLVIGDFRRCQQILVSLLSNAVKFTSQGFVKLTVRVLTIDNRVCRSRIAFEVTDTGVGILPGMESIIFERFRQLEGGFNRGFGGLGIGLATSKEICRLMGAELSYESVPNQGSTFSFAVDLPFSPRSSVAKKAEQHRYEWQELSRNRLALVVEDNAVNQLVLKASLGKLGIQSLTAGNGQEAVQLLLQHPIDIILMDCQMPVMDGFEATRAIRQLSSDKSLVPIVAITANAMSKDRSLCVAAGMNDYMSKPIDTHELKEKLLKWLPLRRPANSTAEENNDGQPPSANSQDQRSEG